MKIIGHRGARGEAPENTLGGFQYIHDLGIRAVEFDVRQLKDDELVIMHDDNFIRTTGIDKNLYECTQTDLNTYNQANIWMDWEKQITPTLVQSLNIMQDFEHIEVEVKAVNSHADAEKITQSFAGLFLTIDFSLAQAFKQFFRLNVHQLDIIRARVRAGRLGQDQGGAGMMVGHQAKTPCRNQRGAPPRPSWTSPSR